MATYYDDYYYYYRGGTDEGEEGASPLKGKKAALKLPKYMHLDSLRQVVNTAGAEFLEAFSTCETHELNNPLMLIVSEKTFSQCPLGKVIQAYLKKLR